MFMCLHIHTKGSSHYKIRLLLVTNQRFTSGPGWMNTKVNVCLQIVTRLKKKKGVQNCYLNLYKNVK